MGHAFFVESEDDAAAGDDHGPADQPGFFGHHADGFAARGFSSSEFVLRMSREEIGSYIGLTLETVSRQFSRLAVRAGQIGRQ